MKIRIFWNALFHDRAGCFDRDAVGRNSADIFKLFNFQFSFGVRVLTSSAKAERASPSLLAPTWITIGSVRPWLPRSSLASAFSGVLCWQHGTATGYVQWRVMAAWMNQNVVKDQLLGWGLICVLVIVLCQINARRELQLRFFWHSSCIDLSFRHFWSGIINKKKKRPSDRGKFRLNLCNMSVVFEVPTFVSGMFISYPFGFSDADNIFPCGPRCYWWVSGCGPWRSRCCGPRHSSEGLGKFSLQRRERGLAVSVCRIFKEPCAMLLVTNQNLRLISEVILLMLRGGIPEDIRPWICGASHGSPGPIVRDATYAVQQGRSRTLGSSIRSIVEPIQVWVQTGWMRVCGAHNQITCSSICPMISTASRVERCSQQSRNTSRGWLLELTFATVMTPICLSTTRWLTVREGFSRGAPQAIFFFFALAMHPCILEAARVTESQHPGGIVFKAFFLDDGVIAAQAQADQLFMVTLKHLLRSIGLEVARNKTDFVLASRTLRHKTSKDVRGYPTTKHFGAAIGTREWCESLLDKRVAKARAVLEAIGCYRDSQEASTLLRFLHRLGKHLVLLQNRPPAASVGQPGTGQSRHPSLSWASWRGGPLADDDWRLVSGFLWEESDMPRTLFVPSFAQVRLARSVVMRAPLGGAFLPSPDPWSWQLALCPTGFLGISHSVALCSKLAFVVFACPSDPKTHTALSVAMSWTCGETTPWRAVVAGTESLVTRHVVFSAADGWAWQLFWKSQLSQYFVITSKRTVCPILTRLTPLWSLPSPGRRLGFPGAPALARMYGIFRLQRFSPLRRSSWSDRYCWRLRLSRNQQTCSKGLPLNALRWHHLLWGCGWRVVWRPSFCGCLDCRWMQTIWTYRWHWRQLQDCTAYLVHPSLGKCARDLEEGRGTSRCSLSLSRPVCPGRARARLNFRSVWMFCMVCPGFWWVEVGGWRTGEKERRGEASFEPKQFGHFVTFRQNLMGSLVVDHMVAHWRAAGDSGSCLVSSFLISAPTHYVGPERGPLVHVGSSLEMETVHSDSRCFGALRTISLRGLSVFPPWARGTLYPTLRTLRPSVRIVSIALQASKSSCHKTMSIPHDCSCLAS